MLFCGWNHKRLQVQRQQTKNASWCSQTQNCTALFSSFSRIRPNQQSKNIRERFVFSSFHLLRSFQTAGLWSEHGWKFPPVQIGWGHVGSAAPITGQKSWLTAPAAHYRSSFSPKTTSVIWSSRGWITSWRCSRLRPRPFTQTSTSTLGPGKLDPKQTPNSPLKLNINDANAIWNKQEAFLMNPLPIHHQTWTAALQADERPAPATLKEPQTWGNVNLSHQGVWISM